MKWAIVVLVVLVLALAGSTAYLGYDRVASDEDGGREAGQPAGSEVAGVTPAATPWVDLELSRRCFDAWAELDMMSRAMRRQPEGAEPREYLDAVLGSGWQERTGSAMRLWDATCLSPNVVPVPNPVSDTNVLCVAARAEALRMSGKPAEELAGWDAARLTVLETFARLRCP